jgi:ABC-type uncharacterized transport system auxiliary subunit
MRKSIRSLVSIGFVAAAAMVTASCISSKPVHYYTIVSPPPPALSGKPDGPTILVGNIVTVEALQDGRIRYRTGANEVGAYEYHRWNERPGTIVRTSLVRALRSTGKYRRVLIAGSAVEGDYLLRGILYEFGELDDASIQTRISLQLELIDKKTERDVWDLLVTHEEPVKGKTVDEVVASLDRNLQHVVREVSEGLDKFLSASH